MKKLFLLMLLTLPLGAAELGFVPYNTTNKTVASGLTYPGGQFTGLLSASAITNRPARRMAILGDSLSSPASISWAYYLNLRSNINGITILTNAAFGGNYMSNMVWQYDAWIAPFAPTNTGQPAVLVIWGGMNDRARSTAEEIWGFNSNIVAKAKGGGFDVVDFTCTFYFGSPVEERRKMETVNSLMRRYSTKLFRLVDTGALFGNPWDMTIQNDGVHLQDEIDLQLAEHVEWVLSQGSGYRPALSLPWEARLEKNDGVGTNLTMEGDTTISGEMTVNGSAVVTNGVRIDGGGLMVGTNYLGGAGYVVNISGGVTIDSNVRVGGVVTAASSVSSSTAMTSPIFRGLANASFTVGSATTPTITMAATNGVRIDGGGLMVGTNYLGGAGYVVNISGGVTIDSNVRVGGVVTAASSVSSSTAMTSPIFRGLTNDSFTVGSATTPTITMAATNVVVQSALKASGGFLLGTNAVPTAAAIGANTIWEGNYTNALWRISVGPTTNALWTNIVSGP